MFSSAEEIADSLRFGKPPMIMFAIVEGNIDDISLFDSSFNVSSG